MEFQWILMGVNKSAQIQIHKFKYSLDWFNGTFTGNHGFYHQI